MRNQIDIETDFARMLVTEKDGNGREWLFRHAVHQLIKGYKKEFGQDNTNSLLTELESYHHKQPEHLTLPKAYEVYEGIIQSDLEPLQKSEALANLMTRMERDFQIPSLHNQEWEKDNKAVISLYRIISESRQF